MVNPVAGPMMAPVVGLVWFTWVTSPVIEDGTTTLKLTPVAGAVPTFDVATAKAVGVPTPVL